MLTQLWSAFDQFMFQTASWQIQSFAEYFQLLDCQIIHPHYNNKTKKSMKIVLYCIFRPFTGDLCKRDLWQTLINIIIIFEIIQIPANWHHWTKTLKATRTNGSFDQISDNVKFTYGKWHHNRKRIDNSRHHNSNDVIIIARRSTASTSTNTSTIIRRCHQIITIRLWNNSQENFWFGWCNCWFCSVHCWKWMSFTSDSLMMTMMMMIDSKLSFSIRKTAITKLQPKRQRHIHIKLRFDKFDSFVFKLHK